MKHLQHTSETFETDACNVRFSPFFRTMQRRAGQWRTQDFRVGYAHGKKNVTAYKEPNVHP
jgi:hypothetical protein